MQSLRGRLGCCDPCGAPGIEPCPASHPATCECSCEAAGGCPRSWVPAAHTGDLGGGPDSWPRPGCFGHWSGQGSEPVDEGSLTLCLPPPVTLLNKETRKRSSNHSGLPVKTLCEAGAVVQWVNTLA